MGVDGVDGVDLLITFFLVVKILFSLAHSIRLDETRKAGQSCFFCFWWLLSAV